MKKSFFLIFIIFFISSNVFSQNNPVTSIDMQQTFIPVNKTAGDEELFFNASAGVTGKYVTIERVNLSPEANEYLSQHIGKKKKASLFMNLTTNPLPPQLNVGMNGVPVLNQGLHNTCATFSVTAALDAIYGHGDYISQLCHLELSEYMHKQDKIYPNEWDKGRSVEVLQQIHRFGIISKDKQKAYGCAGFYNYPLMDRTNRGLPMSLTDYRLYSEDMFESVRLNHLFNVSAAFSNEVNMEIVLMNTKQALLRGNRVLVSILVDDTANNGAFGFYKVKNDSWVVTKEIIRDIKIKSMKGLQYGRHGLIITGYDDNAVITDSDNIKHQGVLTLRNSWGENAGDHGDYYMSYEYFETLVDDVIEVVPFNK